MSSSHSNPTPGDTSGWITDKRIGGRPSVRTAAARLLDAGNTTLGVSRSTLDHQNTTAVLDIATLAHADGMTMTALEIKVYKRLDKVLGERYDVSVTLHGSVLHVHLRDKEVKK